MGKMRHCLYTFPVLLAMAFSQLCNAGNHSESEHAQTSGQAGTGNENCPVLQSRHWHAWIERATDNNVVSRLIITGQVDMPTPGYTVTFTPGPLDRRQPPTLRVMLNAKAPQGMSLQVIDIKNISFRMDTEILNYRAIIVACGDEQLTEIAEVTPME